MIHQQKLLLLVLSSVLGIEAFSVSKPSATTRVLATTTLSAEAEAGGEDILNSPEFLKRKVDVLKSDIEKADQNIAELTSLVEEGKAEWGDQLDGLQVEVRQTHPS